MIILAMSPLKVWRYLDRSAPAGALAESPGEAPVITITTMIVVAMFGDVRP